MIQIPVYSLLHEASHGLFHPDRRTNEGLGRWLAVLFGMSFTFYRHCHTRHHVKNRTDIELWDLYRPQDVRWKRAVNLYLMLTGAGYALVWISVLVFALAPRLAHAAFIAETPIDRPGDDRRNVALLRRLAAEGKT